MRTIEVPPFIKGLIFDCDGTLVDSMPLHMKAWEYVITSRGGLWDFDFFFSKKGMPEEEIVVLYNAHFARAFDPVDTVKDKHKFFRAHASEFRPIPHRGGCRPEISAASCQWLLPRAAFGRTWIWNWTRFISRSFFQAIVTADDDVRPKPAPDIFLEAARRIGVAPEYCQVFEDGDLGLEAARIAGMLPTDVR